MRSALFLVVALSCAPANARPPRSSLLAVETVLTGLSIPVFASARPGDDRLFIVEKTGAIRLLAGGKLAPRPFLSIEGQVSSGMEQGLLGLAFHPAFEKNGLFYVNYTDTEGDTRIVRYTVSADRNVADAASKKELLRIEQPYANHNGGMIAFGPDGMLYIGMGDGGSAGDPKDHAENRATLLGDLLRIDVDRGDPYSVPPDNPFVGKSGMRGEIWAFGLRNPWRFAFDDGLLYIADVGQNDLEEIDVAEAKQPGLDYGWDPMEGSRCFEPKKGCAKEGRVLPVVEYGRDDGCSITGGYVYRGKAIPELGGHYLYSDFCTGFLRSFRYRGGKATEQREYDVKRLGAVTSFGQDAAGELYVMTYDGTLSRIVKKP